MPVIDAEVVRGHGFAEVNPNNDLRDLKIKINDVQLSVLRAEHDETRGRGVLAGNDTSGDGPSPQAGVRFRRSAQDIAVGDGDTAVEIGDAQMCAQFRADQRAPGKRHQLG